MSLHVLWRLEIRQAFHLELLFLTKRIFHSHRLWYQTSVPHPQSHFLFYKTKVINIDALSQKIYHPLTGVKKWLPDDQLSEKIGLGVKIEINYLVRRIELSLKPYMTSFDAYVLIFSHSSNRIIDLWRCHYCLLILLTVTFHWFIKVKENGLYWFLAQGPT